MDAAARQIAATLPAAGAVVAEVDASALAPGSDAFAARLDAADPLAAYRGRFRFPAADASGRPPVYLCGNSLGLQPTSTRAAVLEDLDRWAALGVEGHFEGGDAPGAAWWTIEDCAEAEAARVVGAARSEVVVMNSLTTNLHLLLSAFYRPAGARDKILMEAHAFPSDEYAVQSCVRARGLDPDVAIVRVQGDGAALVKAVEDLGDQCAVVLVGAVQYYSGEWFDGQKLAAAAHNTGALLGLDCAHAAGNVPLKLHDDGVDFACWCSYKYLNSGPGALAGAFVHERHDTRTLEGALRGWWGHERATRFEMKQDPVFRQGAAGLQLSNPPTLAMVALREAYRVHDAATMPALREKSLLLTSYLELLVALEPRLGSVGVVTPRDPARRGAQLSLRFDAAALDGVLEALKGRHVFVDARRPDVIRVAPAPLYNSFADVLAFVRCLADALDAPAPA